MTGRLIRLALILVVGYAAFTYDKADAHYVPGTHNAVHAIQLAWCGKSNRHCWQGDQAIRVARCESGSYWDRGIPRLARNGQYLGLFQFGEYARSTYGFGWDPWRQAFAARRMFRAEGWRPWECASLLGIR